MVLPSWGFDVVGTVWLDLDRHPVAGATVRFTEQGSGDPFETRTTASGSYVVSLPDIATSTSSSASCAPNHTETQLGAAFPNPFNPLAVIPFHLSHSTQVRLQVYDLLGSAGATPGGSRSGRGHLSNRVGRNERSSPDGGRRGLLLSLGGGRIRGQPKADHVGWEQESAFHGELVAQGGGTGAVRRGGVGDRDRNPADGECPAVCTGVRYPAHRFFGTAQGTAVVGRIGLTSPSGTEERGLAGAVPPL